MFKQQSNFISTSLTSALVAFSLLVLIVPTGLGESHRIDIETKSACSKTKIEKPAPKTDISYDASLTPEKRVARSMMLSFRNELQTVLNNAYEYIKDQPVSYFNRAGAAVVLDLDETVMDNRAYYLIYGEYDPKRWAEWETKEEAPGIPETLDFIRWLNNRGYSVYFISGRREANREHTVNNLKKMGITDYAGLYLKPDDYNKDSASNYKVEARKDIEAKGHKILATIGDQNSDISGGYGKGFKLPNSIYYIP